MQENVEWNLQPIAFMADIEQMFFQVFVPEEQRSFLRFLWWENAEQNSRRP